MNEHTDTSRSSENYEGSSHFALEDTGYMPDTTTKYNKTEDLVGLTFGHSKVLSFSSYKLEEDNRSTKKRAHWLVRCTRCNREHVVSIRNLKGKKVYRSGQWKEVAHKVFLCDCDKERKLFHKVHKKMKVEIPFSTFLEVVHQPCYVCGKIDSYDLEENEVMIYYNRVIHKEDRFISTCEVH